MALLGHPPHPCRGYHSSHVDDWARAGLIGRQNSRVSEVVPRANATGTIQAQDITPPLLADRRVEIMDEKHEPGGHQPERPGDVGDRDDGARKFPALLLEGADEFEGADKEG